MYYCIIACNNIVACSLHLLVVFLCFYCFFTVFICLYVSFLATTSWWIKIYIGPHEDNNWRYLSMFRSLKCCLFLVRCIMWCCDVTDAGSGCADGVAAASGVLLVACQRRRRLMIPMQSINLVGFSAWCSSWFQWCMYVYSFKTVDKSQHRQYRQ